jgi:subtilisin family serine protease
VVTVSAVGRVQLKSYYSSYGQGVVELAAPGGDTRQPNPNVSTTANAVLSTVINTTTRVNGWGYLQGTSMASPHVAGVAALALSAHPGMQPRSAGIVPAAHRGRAAVPAGHLRPASGSAAVPGRVHRRQRQQLLRRRRGERLQRGLLTDRTGASAPGAGPR